jgi:hypothetical protein
MAWWAAPTGSGIVFVVVVRARVRETSCIVWYRLKVVIIVTEITQSRRCTIAPLASDVAWLSGLGANVSEPAIWAVFV